MTSMINFFSSENFESNFKDQVKGSFGRVNESSWRISHSQGTLFGLNTGPDYLKIMSVGVNYAVAPMMYFSISGTPSIEKGSFWYVYTENYRCMNSTGGPLELSGRLNYIDGCTDSLLVSPVIKGDPCLNALYFPPGIEQTFHTHPSCRIGYVVSGHGICDEGDKTTDLIPGMAFIIEKNGLHRFRTEESALTVVAFHPDSDFGPEHHFHPMINKTIVNGKSASSLEEIRTKS